ncbi:MAG: hypothetical protein Q9197_001837 [Variospora fuerteventurae]
MEGIPRCKGQYVGTGGKSGVRHCHPFTAPTVCFICFTDLEHFIDSNARDILKNYWDRIGGKPGPTTSSARKTAKKRPPSSKGTGDEPEKQPKQRRGRKSSSTLAAIHTGSSSQRDGGRSPLASKEIREKANADRAARASKRKKDFPAPRASRKNIARPLVAQPGDRGEHGPSTPPATGSAEAGHETAMQR